MKRFIAVLLIFIAVPYMAPAAEVKNLKVSQTGDKAVATYDLVGRKGEKKAEVTVAIIIGGQRITSDKLSFTGDFGKGVNIGKGKKIVWNNLKKLPPNFDRKMIWDVKVTNSQETAKLESRGKQEKGPTHMVLVCRSSDTLEYCYQE